MFKKGQIFENEYPMEAAMWCNENNLIIDELPEEGGVHKFIIKEIEITETLEEAVQRATHLINAQANSNIEAGFEYNGYHYNFDTYDQLNFNEAALNTTDPIQWYVYKDDKKVAITINRATFTKVFEAASKHKQSILQLCNGHKQELSHCKTVKEVNTLLTKYYG